MSRADRVKAKEYERQLHGSSRQAKRKSAKDLPQKVTSMVVAMTLGISLFALGSFTQKAEASFVAEVSVEIKQVFNHSVAAPPNSTFSYRLIPQAATNPMPASGRDFSIKGTSSATINLIFSSWGTFYYNLNLLTPAATGYTLDSRSYVIEVYVTPSQQTAVSAYNSSGQKVGSLLYTHSFRGQAPSVPPVEPPVQPPVNPPVQPPVVPPVQPPAQPPAQPPVVQPPAQQPTLPPTYQPVQPPASAPALPPIYIPMQTPPAPAPEPQSVVTPNPSSRNGGSNIVGNNALPVVEIEDTRMPLFSSPGVPSWALVNLLLAVIGVLVGAITLIRALRQRRREAEEKEIMETFFMSQNGQVVTSEYEDDLASSEREHTRRKSAWLAAVCATTIVGVLVFVLTQDMTAPMVLMDWWTFVNAGLLGLELVAMNLVFKKVTEEEEDSEMPAAVSP
ncbi:MAG: hypothetical protein FWD27_00890 [Coriobacteriia bacterium]|nr:hypothetical protein [Coriobacteriia bacterium]